MGLKGKAGDLLYIAGRSAAAAVLLASAEVEYDDGHMEALYVPDTTLLAAWSTGFEAPGSSMTGEGTIVGAQVDMRSGPTTPYQTWCRLVIRRESRTIATLCKGYVYSNNPLTLGDLIPLEENAQYGYRIALNVTYQQANAAGGAIVVDVNPASGNEISIEYGQAVNSGTNGIQGAVIDSGNADITILFAVASGVATLHRWGPGDVDTSVTGTGNAAGTGYPFTVRGTDSFTVRQTGAGALNDTMQIVARFRTIGDLPVLSKARSTNAANVSVSAGSAIPTVLA